MPDESCANASGRSPMFDISGRLRLLMVVCGYVPFIQAVAIAGCLVWFALMPHNALPLFLAFALVYLIPPVIVRATLRAATVEPGAYSLESRMFLRWWFSAQFQVLHNRLPFLEELLRLVPGLYSAWLRLWGSRIGRLTFWAPGTFVLDRSLLSVGDRVVFGVGARLHAHVIDRDAEGNPRLFIGAIGIGDDTLIGGMSLLAPGVTVDAGETTPAVYALPAFAHWSGGRRVRRNFATIR